MNGMVLIVDDEAEAGRALARLLRVRGWSPTVVRTAEEAHATLEREIPDAIVVDVVGTVRPGVDLARDLKGRVPYAKVLTMSGYTPAVLATIGVDIDRDTFLPKPFDRETLATFFPQRAAPIRDTIRMAAVHDED